MNWPAVVDVLGNPSAGIGILIESAGVPFPGEALLLAGAAWTASRHQSIVLVIVCGFVGATAGADIGYLLGYRGGRPFVERFGQLFHIRPDNLARAELFFARHGDKSIVGARFFLGARTWSAMLAGMARMPFWRFQLFSAVGGLLWSASIGIAGYVVGSNLALLETIFRAIGVGGTVILVLILLVLYVARERATRPR